MKKILHEWDFSYKTNQYSDFLLLEKTSVIYSLKKRSFNLIHSFGASSPWLIEKHSEAKLLQKWLGRKAQWRKAMQLMAIRKQEKERRSWGGRHIFQRHIPSNSPLLTPHLVSSHWVRTSLKDQATDEYVVPINNSPSKNFASGYMRIWGTV